MLDSNRPYQRVNVQSNNNDTIWNGAAWGAGAGIGAMGLTYGVTTFGASQLDRLNYKVAGNKSIREQMRHDRLKEKGKPHLSNAGLQDLERYRLDKADKISNKLYKVNQFGNTLFGSGSRKAIAGATGLMGGMLVGGAVDYMN